ncbi:MULTISPECIES: DGQHR domain-containing protein [Vibrio]|uniref:DGQHR domain-containing protein n=1 Tax=Vibrio tasmaniensis TaxID=212663 RepID=A0A2N7NNB1_9VIBR|nr:DGQHR domain-containing protein [Vibrio tasmaniensis]PMO89911.1 hypothetical protein BCT01_01105 [Vibrio tasmaniensis]PMP17778.1 hypothetical protein BCS92_05060 [Vibrio tasmaniensis]TKG28016.1 DGQHR domain-containing protein [Vibrio tasmaniensis]TKG41619.1 DGQHR domain-containing protein [Vibrio tasmaniensis]TKG44863.1 DGQHR domain-containing protein [Vibrio tasmaniensis]
MSDSAIDIPVQNLVSPIGEDLELILFKAKEGISKKSDVYEGIMLYQEWSEHFGVEANSDELDEKFKSQRDVDSKRVKGLTEYFNSRKDTSLPGVNIFICDLDVIEEFSVGNRQMVRAVIPADTSRIVSDGQGRTENNRLLMQNSKAEFGDFTIGFKLIVTHTNSIWESRQFVRQHFSDFNGTSSKPSSSTSLLFDLSTPLGRIMNDLLEIHIEKMNCDVADLISLHGKTKKQSKLWTFAQFYDFILAFFGYSKKDLNTLLVSKPSLETSLTSTARDLISYLFNTLPLELLGNEGWKERSDKLVFNKAIFAYAVAKLAKSVFENHIEEGKSGPVDYTVLDKLNSLPLETLDDKLWLTKGISYESTLRSKRVVKINKDSAVKMNLGRLLCSKLRVPQTLDLV